MRQLFQQCQTCQRFKKKKCGKLSHNNIKLIPWGTVYIDLVGPYTVTDQKDNCKFINTMIFVDLAIGWLEIAEIINKTSARKSQIFNIPWCE